MYARTWGKFLELVAPTKFTLLPLWPPPPTLHYRSPRRRRNYAKIGRRVRVYNLAGAHLGETFCSLAESFSVDFSKAARKVRKPLRERFLRVRFVTCFLKIFLYIVIYFLVSLVADEFSTILIDEGSKWKAGIFSHEIIFEVLIYVACVGGTCRTLWYICEKCPLLNFESKVNLWRIL